MRCHVKVRRQNDPHRLLLHVNVNVNVNVSANVFVWFTPTHTHTQAVSIFFILCANNCESLFYGRLLFGLVWFGWVSIFYF